MVKIGSRKKTKMDYFKKKNLKKDTIKDHISPSGKYVLTTANYTTGPNTWNYSKGTIKTSSGKLVAEVYRNYGHFWYSWVEGHADGHDYLVCGEDYQGQTIIRLDTGERKDYLPAEAKQGWGFCWVSAEPSPDKKMIAVDGCYWACPYEVILVDFSDPFNGLAVLGYLDCDETINKVVGWNDDGSINVEIYETHRVSDGKNSKDLTAEEREKMWDDCDFDDEIKVIKTIHPKMKNDDKIQEEKGRV